MSNKYPVFGFDIDDVIVYTFNELIRTAKEMFNVDIIEPTAFVGSDQKIHGELSSSEWTTVIDTALCRYSEFKPIPGSIEFLRLYQKMTGNQIIFITSRNPARCPELKTATENMLNCYISDLDYTIYYSRSGIRPKVNIANECGIQFFVEDRLKYVKEISSTGIYVLMPLRRWNERYLRESVKSTTIIPVTSWGDINVIFDSALRLA